MRVPLDVLQERNARMSEIYTTWGYSKLLQHTDVLYRIQKENRFSPIQVQICPTELCESDCPFCSVGYRPYKSSMPWPMITKCLEDFKLLGAKSVEITGGGNPLLYRDGKKNINDLIRYAADLGLDIGIITNSERLNVLNPDLYRFINWIRISLIKLDEGKEPQDYDFAGFPYSKLGFSYIIYEGGEGCRTKRPYAGTSAATIERIAQLVNLHPEIKFVRIAGNCLIPGENERIKREYQQVIDAVDKYAKFFIKDIGSNDFPFNDGCYVGMIRPYVAASPKGDGKYYVYICNSHVLFMGQKYDTDYALCEVQDVLGAWEKLNENHKELGYPYQVRNNCGRNWQGTCKLCFYQINNQFLHTVATELPDKNFP